MKAELNGTSYMVSIERDEVVTFANSWPGNNLDIDATYVMEFSSGNGDLVDLVKYVDGKLCQLDEDEDGQNSPL